MSRDGADNDLTFLRVCLSGRLELGEPLGLNALSLLLSPLRSSLNLILNSIARHDAGVTRSLRCRRPSVAASEPHEEGPATVKHRAIQEVKTIWSAEGSVVQPVSCVPLLGRDGGGRRQTTNSCERARGSNARQHQLIG